MPNSERSDTTVPPASARRTRSPRRRMSAAVVGVACAALLASGCGPGEDAEQPDTLGKNPSGLLTALAHAAPRDGASETVAFMNSAEFRKLSEADPEWFGFTDPLGSPALYPRFRKPEDQGFDTKDVELSLVLGDMTGLLLGSFDAERVTSTLKADGYRERDQDGRTVLAEPDEEGPAPHLVWEVSDRGIAYGAQPDRLGQVDAARGDSLADDPDHRWLSDCLGEVYRVDITRRGDDETVPLIGIGQVAGAPGKTSGVICAPLADASTAERAAEELEKVVEDKADRYRGSEVTVLTGDRPGVRVTVPDRPEYRRAGRLLNKDLDLIIALGGL
ncbi:hypothetical protein [Streptomyces megasporus]|uniref:hypothetical protein n=1 Tax=Streptomyces megasporus TaxID=44060 RepID=UPI000689A3CF|nr:hypothetical protein [Streptomyces megasporus]